VVGGAGRLADQCQNAIAQKLQQATETATKTETETDAWLEAGWVTMNFCSFPLLFELMTDCTLLTSIPSLDSSISQSILMGADLSEQCWRDEVGRQINYPTNSFSISAPVLLSSRPSPCSLDSNNIVRGGGASRG
jgi:hypothetical protein